MLRSVAPAIRVQHGGDSGGNRMTPRCIPIRSKIGTDVPARTHAPCGIHAVVTRAQPLPPQGTPSIAWRRPGVPSRVAVPPHHSKGPTLVTFNLLVLIGVIGGVLALVDGIRRLRARGGNTIVGIIEVIVGALFILSFFVPVPWGSLVLGVATLIVLVVALFLGGRTGRGLTIAAAVVIAAWIVLVNHWLIIPGIN